MMRPAPPADERGKTPPPVYRNHHQTENGLSVITLTSSLFRLASRPDGHLHIYVSGFTTARSNSANDPPVFNHVQNLFRFTDSDRNRHQDTSAGRGQVLCL